MSSMSVEVLDLGLVYFKNVIDDPQYVVNKIEELEQKIIDSRSVLAKHHAWKHWDDGDQIFCYQKFLPIPEKLNPRDMFYEEQKEISTILINALEKALEEYFNMFPIARENVKSREDFISVLKYMPGHYLPAHSDQGISSRIISALLYLNDDYEGGNIKFPNSNISMKPEAGSAIFFPSNYIYIHEIDEIKSGSRYVLPNWYHNRNEKDKIESDGTV